MSPARRQVATVEDLIAHAGSFSSQVRPAKLRVHTLPILPIQAFIEVVAANAPVYSQSRTPMRFAL